MHRTARAGLRVTQAQRGLLGLLASGGDVWACVLELNAWRRARQDRPLVSYLELCRELAYAGHRDLSAAASIAARLGGGITPVIPAGVTHRRAGAHLPGVAPRDVTRAAAPITAAPAGPLAGTGPPAPAP
jgi:hypothetical protein